MTSNTELELMLELNHPNIIRPLAWFQDGNNVGYVMKVIQSGSLENVLTQLPMDRPVPENLIGDIMVVLVPAMAYIHSRGITHWDISLGNTFVETENGSEAEVTYVPFIGDFGLAEHISKDKMFHHSATADPRISDVHSLGWLILGMNEKRIELNFDDSEFVNLGKLSKAYNEQLADFVARMVATDRAHRPRMNDMLSDPWLVAQFKRRHMPVPKPFPYMML